MNKIGEICPEPPVTSKVLSRYLKSIQPQLLKQFEKQMLAYRLSNQREKRDAVCR